MPSDKDTIENLHNLLRALVFKFGRDVVVTKDEFMQSLQGSLSIQQVPQDEIIYLRIWILRERSND